MISKIAVYKNLNSALPKYRNSDKGLLVEVFHSMLSIGNSISIRSPKQKTVGFNSVIMESRDVVRSPRSASVNGADSLPASTWRDAIIDFRRENETAPYHNLLHYFPSLSFANI